MDARFASGEDRLDRYWAAAISAALHLAVVWALTWTSEIRPGESTLGTSSGPLSLRWLGEDEFRQPLVALSPAKSMPVVDPEPEVTIDPTPAPLQAAADATITETATGEQTQPGMSVATAASAMPNAGATGQAAPSMEMPLETPPYDSREQAYLMALRAAIQSKWTRQSTRGRCAVTIQQTIGGQVMGAISKSCTLGQADRRALEAAALAAQPLPYAGFERVFREQITVEMEQ